MSPSIRGHFLWHELLTTDPDAAKAFYGAVVGWTAAPWGEDYTVWMTDDQSRGGMMRMPAEVRAAGTPPHWGTYIGTEDVDATIRQAEALGAKVLMPAMDVAEVGRMALLQDPQGAAFHVFTPVQGEPPKYPATIGGFAWNELATTDWQSAFAFYSTLFGWRKGEAMDMGPIGVYQMIEIGGSMGGAMFNKPPEMPVPNWLPYAEVKSAQRAAAAVKAAGGMVLNGPMDVPGGAIVQFMDPQGAVFAVHATVAMVAATPVVEGQAVATKPAKKPAGKKAASKKATKSAAKKAARKKPTKNVAKKTAKKKPTKSAPKKAARKRPAKKAAKHLASKAVKKAGKNARKVARKPAKKVAKKPVRKPKQAAKRRR